MSKRRKRQFRFATFAILPVLLALAALVPAFLSFNSTADATDASDWTKVKNYVASYIQYQYDAGEEGEAGFLITLDDGPAQPPQPGGQQPAQKAVLARAAGAGINGEIERSHACSFLAYQFYRLAACSAPEMLS